MHDEDAYVRGNMNLEKISAFPTALVCWWGTQHFPTYFTFDTNKSKECVAGPSMTAAEVHPYVGIFIKQLTNSPFLPFLYYSVKLTVL